MSSRSLHQFQRKLEKLHDKVDRSNTTAENKRLIHEFDRYLAAEGLTAARRWKLLEYIHVFCTRHFKGECRGADTKKIWNAVLRIESTDLAPWTKHDFKVAIRKFYKFLEWGHDALRRTGYPESVAGISVRIRSGIRSGSKPRTS